MGPNCTVDAAIIAVADAGGNTNTIETVQGMPCTVKERAMNKKVIKPIVLMALFFVAIILFSITTNKDNRDMTTTMAKATLPVVYFQQGDNRINELHGYVDKMDATQMRDSITPVDNSRVLPIIVATYGKKIDAMRFEIRSMDGKRLVAKSNVTDYKTSGNNVTANLMIQNILDEDQEYTMIVTLQSEGQEIYYYTRLMQTIDSYVKECVDFALQFHDYTFRDDADTFIPKYMDAATGDATTLHYVDLTCTLKQITWADLKPKQIGDTVASIKEINTSYNVITISYVASYVNGKGETEYYNVEEYYRLRMTSSRMYVLNFERTTNQIFRGENNFISDGNSIQLGIRDGQIEYAMTETGTVVAFVQEGELWCFDRINKKIVQVFSFRDTEGTDIRDDWGPHDIKIVRVDEAGSVDFVVYGYMNRGDHEGQVGTAVYHYDGLVQTMEEEVFIPSTQSYEILKAEMGQLMYVNDKGNLYLFIDEKLYRINLTTLKEKVIVDGLKESCYQTSQSNQYLAWGEADNEYSSTTIHLMNLQDESVYDIKESDNLYLRPLGFINNDFIYGVAKKDNVVVGAAGNTVFPMDYLKIMSTSQDSHDIVKKYKPKSGKVESVSVQDYTITIQLMKKTGGHYISGSVDSIMNRAADTETKVSVGQTVTDIKQTQYQLVMKATLKASSIKMITSKSVLLEKPRTLALETKDKVERFYVYEKGDVVLATDNISDAIVCANENLGVVVDSQQQYIWMRARKSARNAFANIKVNDTDKNSSSVVQAVSAMLAYHGDDVSVKTLIDAGATPKQVIEDEIKDAVVLDVSGCSVDEIIFYVSEGSPVFAMTGNKSAVLVTGYSASHIYYYDPETHSTKSKSFDEANKWFSDAGNIFFTYLVK